MKQIRSSKFSKFVAYYLAIMMFLQITQPMQMYALTSGPTQPEFNAFTPIGTSDMVDLASGDFNYNIPIMDVGGYPINLAYNSGITMDQEASWVGLGWNLNIGQIERQVRGLPDDFNGERVEYINNLKPNRTVGFTFRINGQIVGFESGGLGGNAALTLQHNNYNGISAIPSLGFSYNINNNVSVGMNITSSATEGVSVNPSVNFSTTKERNNKRYNLGLSAGLGLSYNSRQGLQNYNLSAGSSLIGGYMNKKKPNRIENTSIGLTSGNATFNFVNNTFTPTIRNEFTTISGTIGASLGGHAWLVDGEIGVDGFYSSMKLKERHTKERAFGYEFTQNANETDLLDFNRENDRPVTKNIRVLPVTNYTYDTYSMQTQGMSGSFRPYQSQVGYVFDQKKQDNSYSGSVGVEVEPGFLSLHLGVDVKYSQSDVNAGVWNTPVTNYFKKASSEKLKYENTYYKFSSDFTLNNELSLLNNKLGENKAIDFKLLDVNNLSNIYRKKEFSFASGNTYSPISINQKIKRESREYRNQLVYKVTKEEADNDAFIKQNTNAEAHHTAGYKAVNNDGSTYVFGETVYNTNKNEVTFAIPKGAMPDSEGIYTDLSHASESNKNGIDHYYNKIVTPNFANTYLLTSVLSTDYEDITGDGPTDDDLGSYTKFVYKNYGDYKWRAPYYGASYNPGFNSDRNHKKASYTYGEKELKYISRIETKTHVAIFELSERKDGLGVDNEKNTTKNFNSSSKMYKLDKVKLYSMPEAIKANLLNDDPNDDLDVAPIKTAHFVYNYDLCGGIHNNYANSLHYNETSNNGGKLTLEKVYFTYRNSNMGKYTPYVFKYNSNNPDYEMKAFDVWGNYKENIGTGAMLPVDAISSVEFPYVNQNQDQDYLDSEGLMSADENTAAWTLESIHLPSGGVINIETESDDYQYVQDKRAMQMFKVLGVSEAGNNKHNLINQLYNSDSDVKYIAIETDELYDNDDSSSRALFLDKYIGDHIDKPIFFRFMLNMFTGSNDYDYVEGYFKIDKELLLTEDIFGIVNATGVNYALIPMVHTDIEGGVNGNRDVNPVSKAGWYFGRQNLNKTVYGLPNDPDEENVLDVINAIGSSFQTMIEIFSGPNGRLRNQEGCAKYFKPEKSWIRLLNPSREKLGGGSRVKSVTLSDNWKNMLDGNVSNSIDGTDLSNMDYGQVYEYDLEDGTSSGVATYEPLGAKDNPLIMPFYDKGEKLVAPKETNYTEKPFGASFFPSPAVTYSRVVVRNIPREREQEGKIIKKHATGYVVNHFYTSNDFPTKTDFTELNNGENLKDSNPNPATNFLAGILGLPIVDETKLTASQGFVVETNDMNGKQEKQQVYDENNNLISEVEYKYKMSNGELDNEIHVIKSDGTVSKSLMGVDYDVINDFRQNVSSTKVLGVNGNVSIDTWFVPPPMFLFVTVVVTVIPSYAKHDNILRMATTTKVIHKKGILEETIAKDLGSTVSTKNLLWDAQSGQTLLTETVNEYDDHYYSFSYPAYWMYKGMGLSSNNIGIQGVLESVSGIRPPGNSPNANNPYFIINGENDLTKYFHIGDELVIDVINSGPENEISEFFGEKLWIVGFNNSKSGILLMDSSGNYFNKCADYDKILFKIVRSGYRNLQSASMASITSMINPLRDIDGDGVEEFNFNSFNFDGVSDNPRIVNASAVVYNDFWRPQSNVQGRYYPEYDLNKLIPTTVGNGYLDTNPITEEGLPRYPYGTLINPYVWNVKGEWRVEKSYAYLTGRNSGDGVINNPRNEGFYNRFNPFYKLDIDNKWLIDETNWTYASSVTKYSPYGPEIENKDALNRYSTAQYGYKYTLPTAVVSNSKYRNMGFENFESNNDHFAFNILNADLTTQESHTGNKSIKIANGNNYKLETKLTQETPAFGLLNNCPVQGTGGGDCSGISLSSNNLNGQCIQNQTNWTCFNFSINTNFNLADYSIIFLQDNQQYQIGQGYSYGISNSSLTVYYEGENAPDGFTVQFFNNITGQCCQVSIVYPSVSTNNIEVQLHNVGDCSSN